MITKIIISFAGLMGFFTIFLILFRNKSNRITNMYLVIIFFIISVRMLLVGLFSIEDQEFIRTLLNKYNNLLIIIVPSVYLYFDTMVKDAKKINFYNYIHFIIPILFNIVDYLLNRHYFEISNVNYYYYSFNLLALCKELICNCCCNTRKTVVPLSCIVCNQQLLMLTNAIPK